MTVGELVFANVVDERVHLSQGDGAPAAIYLQGVPGRALPFVMYRAWKVGTGLVSEEVRFWSPSGRLAYRWGPAVRRMSGSMDLTEERDLVSEARFEESGVHVASFVLGDEVAAEIEVPVYVQQAPMKLPKQVEDGLRKSDVIFVGDEAKGGHAVPAWFAYKNGRIYVLSRTERGPEEQSVPGIPGATEVLVITRRKANVPETRGRDTALDEFPAVVRTLEGPEWEEAAKVLADRRRSRNGPPEESIQRWRGSCAIAELTPILPG
ncbi:MAG TPA: hypothetical protein VE646_11080 [Actinomycetota bacterium]|jgi:hypothetical protein|nr:hypothetical protein [Actinomycetota bacterium]